MTTADLATRGTDPAAGAGDPPDGSTSPRRAPAYVWCLLVALAADLVNGNSQQLHLPVSPDRLFVPLAFLLMLLDGRRPRLRWQAVHTLMLALVAWTIGSMLWHGNLFDVVAVFALADRMVIPLLLFATAPLFFDRPLHRDLLLKTVALIGVYLGVTGILEMAAPGLVFPRYIVDPDVGLAYGRARGPFVASDAMGVSAALCGIAGALAAVRFRSRLWRTIGTLALVTGLATTALSLTRATWFGAAAGLIVGGLCIPRLRRWIPVAFAVIAAAAAAVVVAVPAVGDLFASRLGDQDSVDDRLGSNAAAMSLLKDLPWTGIGWRRFYPAGAEWFRISDDFAMNNVVIEIHNVVLSRAAELGIPAAVCYLAIWVAGPIRAAVGARHGDLFGWRALGLAAFTAWVVTGLMGPMALPFPNYLAWLLAGVAAYPWAVARPTAEGLGLTESATPRADRAQPDAAGR